MLMLSRKSMGGGNLSYKTNLSFSFLKILSVLLLSVFLVIGCGGSSDDSGAGAGTGGNTGQGGTGTDIPGGSQGGSGSGDNPGGSGNTGGSTGGSSSDDSGAGTGGNTGQGGTGTDIPGGSQGGSGSGDNPGGSGNTGGSTTEGVTGKVVYSGVSHDPSDMVCYDRNGNKACDEDEPSAPVSADGSYRITDATEDDVKRVPLVAELYGSNASTGSKFLAKARAANETGTKRKPSVIFETPAGQKTISSITTIIKSKMDMNPALSPSDAANQTKEELKIEQNADLFSTSQSEIDKVKAAAEKVAIVMKSLLDKIAELDAPLNKGAVILLMKDIIDQLPNIAVADKDGLNEITKNTTIGRAENPDAITSEIDKVSQSKSIVQSAAEALKGEGITGYSFGGDWDNNGDLTAPYFKLFKFDTTSFDGYDKRTSGLEIPDITSVTLEKFYSVSVNGETVTGTALNAEDNNVTILEVETIKLDNKMLQTSPLYNSKVIQFRQGAVLHKIRIEFPDALKPFNKDLAMVMNECYGEGKNARYMCTDVNVDFDQNQNPNKTPVRISDGYGNRFDITMRSDKTYNVYFKEARYHYSRDAFTEERTRKGSYEWSADDNGYIFKDEKGVVAFKVFMASDRYKPVLAGNFDNWSQQTFFLFNKVAAEDIKDQWNGPEPTTVQSAVEALKGEGIMGYGFSVFDDNGDLSAPYFRLFKVDTKSLSGYNKRTSGLEIPDAASVTLEKFHSMSVSGETVTATPVSAGDNKFTILEVETIKLDNKMLQASPLYNNKLILFRQGAVLHKIRMEFPDALKSFDKDLNAVMNECYGEGKNAGYWCTNVNISLDQDQNPVQISDGYGNRFEITMRSDKTYNVNFKEARSHYSNDAFTEENTRKGSYEWSADDNGYIFKDEKGVVAFKVFKRKVETGGSGYEYVHYVLAGYLDNWSQQTFFLFNKVAAEDIKDQWD